MSIEVQLATQAKAIGLIREILEKDGPVLRSNAEAISILKNAQEELERDFLTLAREVARLTEIVKLCKPPGVDFEVSGQLQAMIDERTEPII